MHGNGWMWHMGWMWTFWIVLIVVIVLITLFAARSARSSNDPGLSAEEILKRRHARGEITKEEYDRTLEDVRK